MKKLILNIAAFTLSLLTCFGLQAGIVNTIAGKGVDKGIDYVFKKAFSRSASSAGDLASTFKLSLKALNAGDLPGNEKALKELLESVAKNNDEVAEILAKESLSKEDAVKLVNIVAKQADESGTGLFSSCKVSCGTEELVELGMKYYFKEMSSEAAGIMSTLPKMSSKTQIAKAIKSLRSETKFPIALKDLSELQKNLSKHELAEFYVAMKMMANPEGSNRLAKAVADFNSYSRSSYFSQNELWRVLTQTDENAQFANEEFAAFLSKIARENKPDGATGRARFFREEMENKIKLLDDAGDTDRADAGRLFLDNNCFGIK